MSDKKFSGLIKLASLLIKYRIEKAFGSEIIGEVAEIFGEYAGEEIVDKLSNFFSSNKAQSIISAFEEADKLFAENVDDNELKQAIHELPLAGSTELIESILELPSTASSEKIVTAIEEAFDKYWGKILHPTQIQIAAVIYQKCLDKALANETASISIVIFRKVENIEKLSKFMLEQSRFTSTGIETMIKKQDEFSENFNNFSTQVLKQITPSPSSIDQQNKIFSNQREIEINAKLDQCRDLILNNSPVAGRKLLENIKKELDTNENFPNTLFRYYTLLGCSFFDTDNFNEAEKQFELAHSLAPNNPRALANKALSLLILGDYSKALSYAEKAVDLDTLGETSAHSIAFSARMRTGIKIEGAIQHEHLDKPGYARAIGVTFQKEGDCANAEKYLRIGYELDKNDVITIIQFASSILENIFSRSYKSTLETTLILNDEQKKAGINEALSLVSQAVNNARDGDNFYLLADALASRAGIYGLLGNFEAAINDCQEALKLVPNHYLANQNIQTAALSKNDFDLIIDVYQRLPIDMQLDGTLALGAAGVFIYKNELPKALSILEHVTHFDSSETEYQVLVMKALIFHKQGEFKEVNSIRLKVENSNLNVVTKQEILALICATEENFTQARNHLEIAHQIANEALKKFYCFKIAELSFLVKDYQGYINWFDESGMDIYLNIVNAREYATALRKLERYDELLKVARNAREVYGFLDEILLNFEASIYESSGDLVHSEEIEKLLIELAPNYHDYRINHARVVFRQGDYQLSSSIINTIENAKVKSPIVLMQLAQLQIALGLEEQGIRTAYKARKLGINSPEIHHAYIGLLLKVEDSLPLLNPEDVAPNTSILISSKRDNRWIAILDDENTNIEQWEYPANSDFAKHLLGKTIGDSIEFKAGRNEGTTYKIKEIKSIYVKALQETFADFSLRFPENNMLQMHSIDAGESSEFYLTVARKGLASEAAYNAYSAGQLSLEQFAWLVGKNRYDLMSELIKLKNEKIISSQGTHKEQTEELNTARSADTIAIDLSSLITLNYLDRLWTLKKRFKAILIPQVLLDELNETLEQRNFFTKRGLATLSYTGGGFIFSEESIEHYKRNTEQLIQLISFIRVSTNILPLSPSHISDLRDNHSALERIGTTLSATIYIAQEQGVPIYTDDYRMKLFAHESEYVAGFWTQTYLRDLLQKRIISQADYANLSVQLLLANYHYTSVNPKIILHTLSLYQFTTTLETSAVIFALKGPETDQEDALNISSEVMSTIWQQPIPVENKRFIQDALVRALIKGRVPEIVGIKLIERIKRLLIGYPKLLNAVVKEIENFLAVENAVRLKR